MRVVNEGDRLIWSLLMLCLSSLFSLFSAPKVSIITSAFNGAAYVEQFMADIVRQTIFDQCELLFIDANPVPGLEAEVVAKYCKDYPQIRYRHLQQDPGLYAVWNLGIAMAQGEYLTNANLDDRLAPDCYEAHATVLDQNPEIDLVYSNSYITKFPNQTFEKCTVAGKIDHVEFVPDAIKRGNLPSFNPMWRKSFHQKYGLFDESFKIAGDWEMWVRAIVHGAKFKKVPGFHGLFYFNRGGISLNRADFPLQKAERNRVYQKYAEFFVG